MMSSTVWRSLRPVVSPRFCFSLIQFLVETLLQCKTPRCRLIALKPA
jgi:hypothetical protein